MGKALKFVGIAAAIVFTGGAAAIGLALGGFSAAAVAVGTVANYLAIGAVLSGVSALLTPGIKRPRPRADVEYDGTLEPRRILYGTLRVSGMNVIPPLSSGSKNQFLHQVLAVAGHEVDAITDVYFNKDLIASANMAAVSGTAGDGVVTSGPYSNKAWIRRYLGTSTQTADYILRSNFAQWTTEHRGRGVAYLALQYALTEEKVYPSGKPEVTCITRGKKCYDPRLDSSPGANPTNASYIAYTENPALCLADYLIDGTLGLGEDTDRIDWDLVVAAADICEETVTVPSGTQDRYTCNVALLATDRFEDNIQLLASAMMGHCLYSGGQWRMYAGAWSASAFSLAESNIVGGYEIHTAIPYNERYNAVRGSFIDPAREYQPSEFNPRIFSAYESADGERAYKDVQFAACTSNYEAQRNAIILARLSRRRRALTVRCDLGAYKIRPYETGTITLDELGWTNQPVRCESWKFTPDGMVELILREAGSADWSDPSGGEYGTPSAIASPIAGGFKPDEPDNLTAQGLQDSIYFTWTPAQTHNTGVRYKLYEHTSSTPFSSAAVVAQDIVGTSVILKKADTTTRYYWLVAVDFYSGLESDPEPATTGVAGAASGVATALDATASVSSIYKLLDGVSTGDTDSVTVTPSGGTPGYTYAWTRVSGSTAITANSATAATTTFDCSSISDGQTLEAVMRCTVTDNVAATKTVDVVVTFERADTPAVLSVTPSDYFLFKFLVGVSSGNTNQVTATAAGGVPGYSYSWSRISGSTSITANASSSATTSFAVTGITNGQELSAVFRVTATDAAAATATADVSVTFLRED